MDEKTAPTVDPVRLPVLPTGRLEELRRAMQEPTAPSIASQAAGATAATELLPPVEALATTHAAPSASPATDAAVAGDRGPAPLLERKRLEGKVIEVISQIYDPEIPVNIYELGLIYDVEVKEDRSVYVRMTLTAPACPVAGTLPGQVETKIEEIPEVSKANVELVWDPPWSRELMSEAAQLQLGFM